MANQKPTRAERARALEQYFTLASPGMIRRALDSTLKRPRPRAFLLEDWAPHRFVPVPDVASWSGICGSRVRCGRRCGFPVLARGAAVSVASPRQGRPGTAIVLRPRLCCLVDDVDVGVSKQHDRDREGAVAEC